jgi:hypothetical protein
MPRLQLEPGERLLCSSRAVWIRSWWRRPYGELSFTSQRLVFEIDDQRGYRGGLGGLDDRYAPLIDQGRDGLNAVSIGMHRHRPVLLVKTDYETYTFGELPNEEWQRILHDAIESDRTALAELVQRLEQKAAPGASDDPYRGGTTKRS